MSTLEQASRELRTEVAILRERLATAEVQIQTKSALALLETQHAEMRDRLVILEAGAVTHGR